MRPCSLTVLGLGCALTALPAPALGTDPAAPRAHLAGGAWTALGPYGANVAALAIDPVNPAIIYAATDTGGGVFKTADGAATWVRTLAAAPDLGTVALAIDPQHPSTVYASGRSGVYKTLDGGVTWTVMTSGLRSTAVALVIDPSDTQTLYAAGTAGVDKSVDGGNTWAKAGDGLPADAFALALAVDPGAPQTVYAALGVGARASSSGGVFKTTNGGVSWSPAGAVPSPITSVVLAVDPSTPRTVYLAVDTGIYKSTDGATSWTRSNTDPVLGSDVVKSLAIDPGSPRTLYAGSQQGRVLKSVDGGASWALAVRAPDQNVRALLIDPAGSGAVYAGTLGTAALGGVYKSGDRGASWSRQSQGLTAASLAAFAVSPQTANTLYTTTGNELYATHNRGGIWSAFAVPPTLDPDSFVLHIAVPPQAATTLYVVSVVFTLGGHSHYGLFRSADGGASWTALATPSQPGWVAVDPLDDRILYVGPFVQRSSDGGGSWIQLSGNGLPPDVKQLVIDPTSPANVYAVQDGSPNVFKSTDRGLNWQAIGTTLTNLDTLRVDPNSSDTLFAAAGGYVEKSGDGGATRENDLAALRASAARCRRGERPSHRPRPRPRSRTLSTARMASS